MSRNKLVSDLFEQEFNKEENYKAIMKRIEESEKKKTKKPIWKPTLAVLGIVVIVASAFLLFPQGNKQLEGNPQVPETPDQQINDLYINEVDHIQFNLIDNPWRNIIKKNPDITDSVFSMVDKIYDQNFNGQKDTILGGYEDGKLVEYVVIYTDEGEKKLTFDVTLKDFEPAYLKSTYKKDIITHELANAKECYIDNQALKILHFDNKYYIDFIKNDLAFEIELKNFSNDDLEKIINIVIR